VDTHLNELHELGDYYDRVLSEPESVFPGDGLSEMSANVVNTNMPCVWAAWQADMYGGTLLNDPSSNTCESWNNMVLQQRRTMHLGQLIPALFSRAVLNCNRVLKKIEKKFLGANKRPSWTEGEKEKMRVYGCERQGRESFKITKHGRARFVHLGEYSCTCGALQAFGTPCLHAKVIMKRKAIQHYTMLFSQYMQVDPVRHALTEEKDKVEAAMATNVIRRENIRALQLPPRQRRAGRPRRQRFRSLFERFFTNENGSAGRGRGRGRGSSGGVIVMLVVVTQ
jgi:hypothetical protein